MNYQYYRRAKKNRIKMPESPMKGIPQNVLLASVASMALAVLAGRLLGGIAVLKDEAPLGWVTGMTMFYVSFYNGSAYAKWWRLRDLLGMVMVAHREMAANICISHDRGAQRDELRRQILVCLRACTAVIRPEGTTVADWIEACPVINKEEKDMVRSVKSPNTIFAANIVRTANKYLDGEEPHGSTISKSAAGYNLEACRAKICSSTDDLTMYIVQPFPSFYGPVTTLLVYISLFLTPVTLAITHPTFAPMLSFLSTLFLYGTFTYARKYLFKPFRHGPKGGPVSADTFDVPLFLQRTVHEIDDLFNQVPSPTKKTKKSGKKEHNA
eukprot:TRINITY_DN7732_c0_g1_i1.p1 TRINITY_DN7732_c0_g1~~TRINITY_DN7732_c0_g1_i1.p1  ORF type:complete len:326 (+),score=76.02 TRINITY_DN7732_c0_g1_i1:203-1180(+)